MNSPLIIAGPGVPRGKRIAALCYLLDIFPTLGELSGVAGPEGNEGRSLAPILAGHRNSVYSSIFTAYSDVQRAVRDERWKLIVYPQINTSQFFDLESDPLEMHDMANDPKHASEQIRLTALLRDWQKRLGDSQPLTSQSPRPKDFDFTTVEP